MRALMLFDTSSVSMERLSKDQMALKA